MRYVLWKCPYIVLIFISFLAIIRAHYSREIKVGYDDVWLRHFPNCAQTLTRFKLQ